MSHSCETSRKSIFLAIAILCTLPLAAQKTQGANRPKYDVNTEIKMKGTVEDVNLPPKGSEKEIAHLLVKTGTDTVDVYLCPKSFLDDMGVSFNKGDEIALTGSRVKQGEADLILARGSRKGDGYSRPSRRKRQSRLELISLRREALEKPARPMSEIAIFQQPS